MEAGNHNTSEGGGLCDDVTLMARPVFVGRHDEAL